MRGGIIDIFPAGEPEPVRLDLFGDTIESIRRFDPATQRSGDKRSSASCCARSPRCSSTRRPSPASAPAGASCSARKPPRTRSISPSPTAGAIPAWSIGCRCSTRAWRRCSTTCRGASVSLDHQADDVLTARLEMVADHFDARKAVPRDGEVPYRPLPPERLYLDRAGWDAMLARGPLLRFSPFAKPDGAAGVDGGGRPGPIFAQGGGLRRRPWRQRVRPAARAGRTLGRRKAPLVLAAWTRGSRERMANLLREHGFNTAAGDDWATSPKTPSGQVLARAARHRARLRRREDRARLRTGSARRAHQPPAAPAQARRPVHRRGHRTRRGRPRRASGSRHRPLRRAGDAARHRRAARLPAPALRRRRQAVPARREHRDAVALRQRNGRRRRSTSSAAPAGRRARRG